MNKKPFVTLDKVREIAKEYPTPFHLYDEKGIRANAQALKDAFAWNKGYKEYFAVKATPNPFLINILREYGCGCDCSSKTELMMARTIGAVGDDIMFSSMILLFPSLNSAMTWAELSISMILLILKQLKRLAANYLKK